MFVLLFTCFANIKGLSKVQVVMYYDTAFSTCLHYKETKTVSFELQMLMASPKVLILSVFDFSASISHSLPPDSSLSRADSKGSITGYDWCMCLFTQ